MLSQTPMRQWLKVVVLLASLASCIPGALAEDGHFHARRFQEREFHDRAFFDHRYGHDHYYAPRGWVFGALPPRHNDVIFGGIRFYFADGIWYRFDGPRRYVVVAPPLGVVVPLLPAFYTTLWVGGRPYYYANDVYYVRAPDGYEVVAPPPADAIVEQPPANPAPSVAAAPPPSAPAATQVFAYPREGQSDEQTSRDRSDCHRWAVGQTGSDAATTGAPSVSADYRRAITACLEGRGYTVR